jgi:DNA-binding NarL/FixJ family response regulator
VTPTRVLFAAMPAMLRDVVAHGLASQPDVEVAAYVARGDGLAEALRRTGAGAVVTCTGDGRLPDSYRSLMYSFPRLKVVVLTDDGRTASLYRLVISQMLWTEISPQDVLAAIRHRDDDGEA